MDDNLRKIQLAYLKKLYHRLPEDLEQSLLATREKDIFYFKAFGEPCSISSRGISLGGEALTGTLGILIALYACHARKEAVQCKPLKSFRDFNGSMPYQGAFRVRAEGSLIPYANSIQSCKERIIDVFDGYENADTGGDVSFTLFPLPKIPLYYIFYMADEEFPASVTCLFAANAELFLPVDGLADVGECTAKRIVEIVTS